MEIRAVHLGEAKCGLDIGDGSERGEYVNQDYMINVLGRPHRMVNIMYTYYPNDKEWPARISEACKDMEVNFAWDYPYDDYFPFADDGDWYEQIKDIRRHGQDVLLTLTIDCSLDDDTLRKLARKFRTFGRMCIRINHECSGDWFTHNRRFTFEQIADFFERFNNIIKEEAPQVKTIFCAGLLAGEDENGVRKIDKEDAFLKGYKAADIWSADKYLALHYGWPYDIAEANDPEGRYCTDAVEDTFNLYKASYERLCAITGSAKPFIQAEFNADGDVTGAFHQADSVVRYYSLIRDTEDKFIAGVSMYQFRDRGRLGLEIEDPNNSAVGIRQPILDEYKKVLFDDYFYPAKTVGGVVNYPIELRWGGSEDADGISITMPFEGTPEFCEVTLQKDLALMMEFHGKWFYKAPGVETIDLMSAFYEKPLAGAEDITFNMFATPADGENHENGREDWNKNYYATLCEEPKFRIRYEVPAVVK